MVKRIGSHLRRKPHSRKKIRVEGFEKKGTRKHPMKK